MVKESLAERQEALLRENADLDKQVEAMEQRHQRQMQVPLRRGGGASTSPQRSGSKSASMPGHVIRQISQAAMAPESLEDANEGDTSLHRTDGGGSALPASASSSPTRGTSRGRTRLRMDLSASIDSLGAASGECASATASEDGQKRDHEARKKKAGSLNRMEARRTGGGVNSGTNRRHGSSPPSKIRMRKSSMSRVGDSEDDGVEVRPAERDATGTDGMVKQKECDTADASATPDGLGLEATVRYQKARLRVLQDELDTMVIDAKEMQRLQHTLQNRMDELMAENGALKKKYQQTQQLLEKQQELSAAQEDKQKIMETQLAAAQTKVDEIQRAEKQATQQFRSKDVRLNRALEELEKTKALLDEERRTHSEQMVTKTEYEQVIKENKKLDKQKGELLVAFKKQMKLVDLLKRQRIHMEAAKMLSFTEEEFSKTLELG